MTKNSKKYRSLFGMLFLLIVIGYVGYRAYIAYIDEHLYYKDILSSGQNRWIVITSVLCVGIFPILYWLVSSKTKLSRLTLWLGIGAGIFGLIHSHIKGDPIGFGNIVTIFNTILLFSLGIYLICGFSALGSWIERKIIKFKQLNWQEILISFGLGMCGFILIIQILLGIGALYGIVSWILFLGLGFMVWYERNNLKKRSEIILGIIDNVKEGIKTKQIGYISMFVLIILSLSYIYIGIQNAFTPYSTAWDANHEYMYTPKILAENAGVYWGNTVGSNMPGLWHQFLAFIFSLTGCTNGWFGLSSDNIAISMNNISASLVLIFGIAIIFQIFSLISKKNKENEKTNAEKSKKNTIIVKELPDTKGVTMGWTILLLWLTSGMGAFLVIVDNKTDLGVMALALLALLAGLIFLKNRNEDQEKKELLKYIIIAGLLFGFAALAKITAFVDLTLFCLLLIGLWFSPITSLGIGIMVMGLLRKFNILTSAAILTENNAMRLLIIGFAITAIGLAIHLSNKKGRESFGKSFLHLLILGVCFLIPFMFFKLPWVLINQIKSGEYTLGNSLKATFLSLDTKDNNSNETKLLAQNVSTYDEVNDESLISIDLQDTIDSDLLNTRQDENFAQCKAAGNIYSENELQENLQDVIGDSGSEDFGRYLGYGWKQFTKERNGIFQIIKLIWPTKSTCYGLNHDAKVLCNNSSVIDSFKIDDLRAIYENGIKNQSSEAGLLLKKAIDSYDAAKNSGKVSVFSQNNSLFYDEIVSLRQYYQSHSILSESGSVYIPYRYLVPLNISFNWSLQNLSSYYTDIGFVWVIIYILLIISLPYAIFKKDKILVSASLTTLIGWLIRWIIGSAILWYGTALISRTIITLSLFWNQLLKKNDENEQPIIIPRILLGVVFLIFGIQILFNYMRISSQGAGSVFVWYKGNVGTQQIINDDLQPQNKTKIGYGWKNIFDLQFPQYNPIINALADRDNEDGVTIAGTYIQYFLGNQRNIKSDGMLSDFWRNTSDGDLCKTYRRLKNDNTRYLIIDPNIGTVTMGEGNETLFYRFFGKLNSNESAIEMDGTVITLVRLAKLGYLNLISTNNIGSKYAFVLDDNTIRQYFGGNLTSEEIILTRAKMAVLQYFNDANSIFMSIANIFMTRIMEDPEGGIEDIANIYGLEIDKKKVADAANKYIGRQYDSSTIGNLTQDERIVLINYLNIYTAYKQGDMENAQSMIMNLLANSVTGGSQIIALELN